jgi:hypothetical protein
MDNKVHTPSDDVFDPKLYATKADGKFSEITNQISELQARLGDDKKFADTFKEVADRDTKIQEALESTFLKSLENSEKIKTKIRDIIKNTVWLKILSVLNPIGIGLWSLFLVLMTALASTFFKQP